MLRSALVILSDLWPLEKKCWLSIRAAALKCAATVYKTILGQKEKILEEMSYSKYKDCHELFWIKRL